MTSAPESQDSTGLEGFCVQMSEMVVFAAVCGVVLQSGQAAPSKPIGESSVAPSFGAAESFFPPPSGSTVDPPSPHPAKRAAETMVEAMPRNARRRA